jgi:hypothetical protein
MQLGPRFNKAPLPPGQGTGDHVHRIDAKNAYFFLIISVKVGDVMLRTHLREHPNNYAEEST